MYVDANVTGRDPKLLGRIGVTHLIHTAHPKTFRDLMFHSRQLIADPIRQFGKFKIDTCRARWVGLQYIPLAQQCGLRISVSLSEQIDGPTSGQPTQKCSPVMDGIVGRLSRPLQRLRKNILAAVEGIRFVLQNSPRNTPHVWSMTKSNLFPVG